MATAGPCFKFLNLLKSNFISTPLLARASVYLPYFFSSDAPQHRRKNSGFTLIELMVTLSVAGILLSIAVPSFSTMTKRNRVTTQQNDLMGDLMLARMEAVKRSRTVSLCSANVAGTACSGNAGDWHQGWLIYVNSTGSGVYDNAKDTLLRVHDALKGGSTLSYDASTLTFSSRGYLPSNIGDFKLCEVDRAADFSREIAMSATGRPQRSGGSSTTCP